MSFRKMMLSAGALFSAAFLFAQEAKPVAIFQMQSFTGFMQSLQGFAVNVNPNMANALPMFTSMIAMNPNAKAINLSKPISILVMSNDKGGLVTSANPGVQLQNIAFPNKDKVITLQPFKAADGQVVYAETDSDSKLVLQNLSILDKVKNDGIILYLCNFSVLDAKLQQAIQRDPAGAAKAKYFTDFASQVCRETESFSFELSIPDAQHLRFTMELKAVPGTEEAKFIMTKPPVAKQALPALANADILISTTAPNSNKINAFISKLLDFSMEDSIQKNPDDADEIRENFGTLKELLAIQTSGVGLSSIVFNRETGDRMVFSVTEMDAANIKKAKQFLAKRDIEAENGIYEIELNDPDDNSLFIKFEKNTAITLVTNLDDDLVQTVFKNAKPYKFKHAPGVISEFLYKEGAGYKKFGDIKAVNNASIFTVDISAEIVAQIVAQAEAQQAKMQQIQQVNP